MRIQAYINERAGAMLDADHAHVAELVRQPFLRAGHTIEVGFAAPEDLEAQLTAAASDPACDVIIVGGGDGSVRTAARIAVEAGKTLGVLPLGTLNLLARDLAIPLDLAEAAEALAAGIPAAIDVASLNGRIYLCSSMIGLPPRFSQQRQALRGKPLIERAKGYVAILRQLIAARKRLALTIDDGERRRALRVISLAVSNNPYDDTNTFGLSRPHLDTGKLTVYASRHRSGWAFVRALLRALFASWKGDPLVSNLQATRLRIQTRSKRLRVSTDGEVESVETPLLYQIHPGALSVLKPATTSSPKIGRHAGHAAVANGARATHG